jgi:hypothetical protein
MDSMPSITKRFVDTAASGRHYDEKLPGFGLYVGTSGTRSYFLEYRPGRGRGFHKRRITIGKHGAPWTPQTARDKSIEYLTAVSDVTRGRRKTVAWPQAVGEADDRGSGLSSERLTLPVPGP